MAWLGVKRRNEVAYRKYDPTPKAPPPKKPTAKKVAPKASDNKKTMTKAIAAAQAKRAEDAAHRAELDATEQREALARGEASREKRRATLATKRAENAEAMLAEQRLRFEEKEAARERAGDPNPGEKAFRAAEGGPSPGRGPSQVTRTARANLYAAFEEMGGVEQLVNWGRTNPTEFYRIWARLIPVEVDDETKTLPLEVLLEKLSQRADMTVEAAARAIGQEALTEAAKAALVEDAAAALFQGGQ